MLGIEQAPRRGGCCQFFAKNASEMAYCTILATGILNSAICFYQGHPVPGAGFLCAVSGGFFALHLSRLERATLAAQRQLQAAQQQLRAKQWQTYLQD